MKSGAIVRHGLSILNGPGAFRLLLTLPVFAQHCSRVQLGGASVYLFFALSGYWIARMLATKYGTHYGIFVASRFWRLLPIFLICSAFSWAVFLFGAQIAIPPNINWLHQAFSSIAILGYASLPFRTDNPGWSLDIELQFYILAPIIVWIVARDRWAIPLLAVVSACGWVLVLQATLVPYLIFFSLGIATFAAGRPAKFAALLAIITAIGLAALLISPWRGAVLLGLHPGPNGIYNGWANAIVALGFMPWALQTVFQPDTPLDGLFGDLSYIFYLLHQPILYLAHTERGSMLHRLIVAATAFGLTIALSLLLRQLIDRPANRLRARWVAAKLA